jgi:hypothetical protein
MDSLAVIESDPTTFAEQITTAALHDGIDDANQEMFVRIDEDCIETPASDAGARRASYCTIRADSFDALSVPTGESVDAMFHIDTVLGWLEWVDGDRLRATFEGQAGIAARLVLESGDDRVTISCVDDLTVLNSIETVLPTRFDGTVFLDGDGSPMPTTIETTADELTRLVRAVELADTPAEYPLVVRDGRLVVDIDGDSASASAPLSASTEGPAVTNHYGEEFAEVVRGIEGDVTLQTGPGEAVAFVQDDPAYTLRFVVTHG